MHLSLRPQRLQARGGEKTSSEKEKKKAVENSIKLVSKFTLLHAQITKSWLSYCLSTK